MLELLEYVAGGVVLGFYLLVAVVLPAAVIVAFVLLIGTLLGTAIDPAVGALPEPIRANRILVAIGRPVRMVVVRGVGIALFLALVGVASSGPSPGVLQRGFQQIIVTLTAIQDIVATWITGSVLNDMLVQLQPASGEAPLTSLRTLENLVVSHVYTTLKPGVTDLAFRWTFAAFASALVAVYVVLEPARAVRRRIAHAISPRAVETTLSEESLARQAELIAQALARATPGGPAAPAPVAPAAPVSHWGRPGAAPAPAIAPAPAPGAIASQRVAIVTWDGELASELERQLDAAGFAPLPVRSVAEAFASRVWPAIVFIDARHLQWLAPDRLPLLVRARLVAVTRDDVRVPRGWQLDTHPIESGADALLDLLRRRDARRHAPATRGTGA
ncbi:MAG: hypothetical protein KGJ98_08460 [Chloroflexota bacterium]|nr:hypothetical protein [Chloroflexota bacterium]